MREIKFRAIDGHSNEWVYGLPASDTETIDYSEIPSLFVGATEDEDCYLSEIIPGTLCQYTGLKDKNGNEIYEGDIVHMVGSQYMGTPGEFRKVDGIFPIEYQNNEGFRAREKGWHSHELYSHELEVIGNIYSNPELLEGGVK